ncbi:conserved Plasmodium protein, unknown function [Plasmodium malariae]|uniref:Uncharacterized protein n=1 Tax=Plasmodium malariae TaxID=5858 RepID=A0A1C3KCZ7_PLAMA|nr:conserved Plasmodium protein, unknown function [Plasmodium malariae]
MCKKRKNGNHIYNNYYYCNYNYKNVNTPSKSEIKKFIEKTRAVVFSDSRKLKDMLSFAEKQKRVVENKLKKDESFFCTLLIIDISRIKEEDMFNSSLINNNDNHRSTLNNFYFINVYYTNDNNYEEENNKEDNLRKSFIEFSSLIKHYYTDKHFKIDISNFNKISKIISEIFYDLANIHIKIVLHMSGNYDIKKKDEPILNLNDILSEKKDLFNTRNSETKSQDIEAEKELEHLYHDRFNRYDDSLKVPNNRMTIQDCNKEMIQISTNDQVDSLKSCNIIDEFFSNKPKIKNDLNYENGANINNSNTFLKEEKVPYINSINMNQISNSNNTCEVYNNSFFNNDHKNKGKELLGIPRNMLQNEICNGQTSGDTYTIYDKIYDSIYDQINNYSEKNNEECFNKSTENNNNEKNLPFFQNIDESKENCMYIKEKGDTRIYSDEEKNEKIKMFLKYLKCIDDNSLTKVFEHIVQRENDDKLKKQLEMYLIGKKNINKIENNECEQESRHILRSNQNTQTTDKHFKNEEIQTSIKDTNKSDSCMQTEINDINNKLYVQNDMISKKTSIDSIFFRNLSKDSYPLDVDNCAVKNSHVESKERKYFASDRNDDLNNDEYNELKKINDLKAKILEKIKSCYENTNENNDEAAAILMLQDKKEFKNNSNSCRIYDNNTCNSRSVEKRRSNNSSKNSSSHIDNNRNNGNISGKSNKSVSTLETLESMKSFEKEMNLLISHNERLKRRIEKLYEEKEKIKNDYKKIEKIKESQDNLFLATEKHIEKLHGELDNLSKQNESMKGDIKKKKMKIIALESQIDESNTNNDVNDSDDLTLKRHTHMIKDELTYIDINNKLDEFKGQIIDKKKIKTQIDQLQKQLHILKDEIKKTEFLKLENEELKKLLTMKNSNINDYEKSTMKLEKHIEKLNEHNLRIYKENFNLCENIVMLKKENTTVPYSSEEIHDKPTNIEKELHADGASIQTIGSKVNEKGARDLQKHGNIIKKLEKTVDLLNEQNFHLNEKICDLKEQNMKLRKIALLSNKENGNIPDSNKHIEMIQTETEKIYIDKINLLKCNLEASKNKINMLNILLKTSNNQTTQLNKKVKYIIKENKTLQKKYEKCLTYLEKLKIKYDDEILKVNYEKSGISLYDSKDINNNKDEEAIHKMNKTHDIQLLKEGEHINILEHKLYEKDEKSNEVFNDTKEEGNMASIVQKRNINGKRSSSIGTLVGIKEENEDKKKKNKEMSKLLKFNDLISNNEDENIYQNWLDSENKYVHVNNIFEIDSITKDLQNMFCSDTENTSKKLLKDSMSDNDNSINNTRVNTQEGVKNIESTNSISNERSLRNIEKMFVSDKIKKMNENINKYIDEKKNNIKNICYDDNFPYSKSHMKEDYQGHYSDIDPKNRIIKEQKGNEQDINRMYNNKTDDNIIPMNSVDQTYNKKQLGNMNNADYKNNRNNTYSMNNSSYNNSLARSTNSYHMYKENVGDSLINNDSDNFKSVLRTYQIYDDKEDMQIKNNGLNNEYPLLKCNATNLEKTNENDVKSNDYMNKLHLCNENNTSAHNNNNLVNNSFNNYKLNSSENMYIAYNKQNDITIYGNPEYSNRNAPATSHNMNNGVEANDKYQNAKNEKKGEAWIIDIKNNEIMPYRKLQSTILTEEVERGTENRGKYGVKDGINRTKNKAKNREKNGMKNWLHQNRHMNNHTKLKPLLHHKKFSKGSAYNNGKNKDKLHLLVNNISKLVKGKIEEELKSKNISKDILNFEITKIKKKKAVSNSSLKNKSQETTIILSDSMSLSSGTLNSTIETIDDHKNNQITPNFLRNMQESNLTFNTDCASNLSKNGKGRHVNIGKNNNSIVDHKDRDDKNNFQLTNMNKSIINGGTYVNEANYLYGGSYLNNDTLLNNFIVNKNYMQDIGSLNENLFLNDQSVLPEVPLNNIGDIYYKQNLSCDYVGNVQLQHNIDYLNFSGLSNKNQFNQSSLSNNRNNYKSNNIVVNEYINIKNNSTSSNNNNGSSSSNTNVNNGSNNNDALNSSIKNKAVNAEENANIMNSRNIRKDEEAFIVDEDVNNSIENTNNNLNMNMVINNYQDINNNFINDPVSNVYDTNQCLLYNGVLSNKNGKEASTIFDVDKMNNSYLFDINTIKQGMIPPFYDDASLNYNLIDRNDTNDMNDTNDVNDMDEGSKGGPLGNNLNSSSNKNDNSSSSNKIIGKSEHNFKNANGSIAFFPEYCVDKNISNKTQKEVKECEKINVNKKGNNQLLKENIVDEKHKTLERNTRRSKSVDIRRFGTKNDLASKGDSTRNKMKTQIFNYSDYKNNGLRDMSTYADKVLQDMKSLIPSNVSNLINKANIKGKTGRSITKMVSNNSNISSSNNSISSSRSSSCNSCGSRGSCNSNTFNSANYKLCTKHEPGKLNKNKDKIHSNHGGTLLKSTSAKNLYQNYRYDETNNISENIMNNINILGLEKGDYINKCPSINKNETRIIYNDSNDSNNNNYLVGEGVNNIMIGKTNENALLSSRNSSSNNNENNIKKNLMSMNGKNGEHTRLNAGINSNINNNMHYDLNNFNYNLNKFENILKEDQFKNYSNNAHNIIYKQVNSNQHLVKNSIILNRKEEGNAFQSETRRSLSCFREALKKQGILG